MTEARDGAVAQDPLGTHVSVGGSNNKAKSRENNKGGSMSGNESDESCDSGTTRYPWAGPAFFGVVLVALAVFFVWFLRA